MNQFLINTFQITEDEAQILSSSFHVKNYLKGEVYIKSGEVCNHIGFVKKGTLKSILVGKQKELIDHFIFENQFVSDYRSYLSKKESIKTITCLENCTILDISRERLDKLARQYDFVKNIEKKVAEKLYTLTEEKLNDLRLLSAKERYLKLLRSNKKVMCKIPQYEIASYLNISPETVSRIRKILAEHV